MQIVENVAEGLRREFTITVAADEIEAKVAEKLADLSRQVHMKGFRPGKVPPSLLRKMYGQAVMGEVLEETVSSSSQQALQDGELRPATQPKIEVQKFEEGAELEYTLAVEIMPDFEPMDFATLKLERLTAEVDDKRVDQALADMAEQQKSFDPIARARKAKQGDLLVIDFAGSVDGEAFEGGTATDFSLELGSGRFIPGFEDQLVGAKAADKLDVDVTFPDDYPAKELAGKAAVFAVEVKEIREPKATTVDDEFAKRMGLDDLAALKTVIRGQLEQEVGGVARDRLKRALLDALAEKHHFEVPPGMVAGEFEQIVRQIRGQEGGETQDHDHDHEHDHDHDHEHDHEHGHEHGHDQGFEATDEERNEYEPIAERRVRLGLLLSEVGRRNSIEVGADEVNRAIMEQARRFPGQERQLMEFYSQNPEAMAQIRAPLFEDKVVDFILEMAEIKDRTVSMEELAADPDEAAETGKAAKSGKKAAPKKRAKKADDKADDKKAKKTAKKSAKSAKGDDK